MMKFEKPIMAISMFSAENIVTDPSAGSGQSVNVKGTDLVSTSVDTHKIDYNELW